MTQLTIDKKITGFKVVKPQVEATEKPEDNGPEIQQMHENIERPEILIGATYKIKTPLSDHALYITINDVILNQGTDHEVRRPFEIFINSKNLEHFQWVVALTRVISAVFRKGGDCTFLAEELKAVFDPQGGYFKSGGRFMPSLVAEIGEAIENHMKSIGLLQSDEMSDHQKAILAEKRAEYEARNTTQAAAGETGYPASAELCNKCSTKAVIILDGCKTCLSCGNSKCG
ncbi:ribonucleotide reductase subunit alpha [Simiduia agarivorans]|uniref:ribonucleoside-diphosphate reductase n=1 Tax=Simiduia agarivorans (strain DSM 21679 / JCM 13881 / BCRC 17597 / SA1) TaxID=1117647 RepID=K4KPL8_SIMAS|nr:ribonucleotide reductase subunit alpha [Simiduia agarivorans]AFV00156.1 ribonucleotide reductase, subunit alpha [Simiduia agarivorans SA1 = DSM 21679]